MSLVVAGRLNKQIGGEPRHYGANGQIPIAANIMQKMQAESLADLVRMAEKTRPFNSDSSGPWNPIVRPDRYLAH